VQRAGRSLDHSKPIEKASGKRMSLGGDEQLTGFSNRWAIHTGAAGHIKGEVSGESEFLARCPFSGGQAIGLAPHRPVVDPSTS
jgi:hypothetical protein